ncbi:hypothetical protein CPB84DRAFT_1784952 [Gymnopilus junonius]|uniref:Uncharacterized protein n=1 Tax=Gymnopilus junonius TaxID=109634 RepID=A0A9P5NK84_GYMJU|nr:hypothetical protein CPB84DRAFT_1784952 [Gymnopilus junonius]
MSEVEIEFLKKSIESALEQMETANPELQELLRRAVSEIQEGLLELESITGDVTENKAVEVQKKPQITEKIVGEDAEENGGANVVGEVRGKMAVDDGELREEVGAREKTAVDDGEANEGEGMQEVDDSVGGTVADGRPAIGKECNEDYPEWNGVNNAVVGRKRRRSEWYPNATQPGRKSKKRRMTRMVSGRKGYRSKEWGNSDIGDGDSVQEEGEQAKKRSPPAEAKQIIQQLDGFMEDITKALKEFKDVKRRCGLAAKILGL